MPPKTKVTRDMIVRAAVDVARQDGVDKINARTVAEQLHCSTQPVMYHFATYEVVDRMHTEFLMDTPPDRDPILGIGLNYIRFAVEEPWLFRFLFQSGYAKEKNLLEMIESEALTPILQAMREGLDMDLKTTKDVFITVALFAHGYASIIANNDLEYDEAVIARHLERVWDGAVLAASKEEKH